MIFNYMAWFTCLENSPVVIIAVKIFYVVAINDSHKYKPDYSMCITVIKKEDLLILAWLNGKVYIKNKAH